MLKNRSSFTEEHNNVKPVRGPLFRPQSILRIIKRHYFLVTLYLYAKIIYLQCMLWCTLYCISISCYSPILA